MTTAVLAIDPGPDESAYALIRSVDRWPIECAKVSNADLRLRLLTGNFAPGFVHVHDAAIEMVASYGMAVGAEVFETCVWIGRFMEAGLSGGSQDLPAIELRPIKRLAVKLHHCHDSKAKDPNITRALVDRFAYGQPNYGKGTKAKPGWFHGFSKDMWQAYALAVLIADEVAA